MFCRRVPVPRRPGPQKHDPCPGDVYVPLSPLPAPQDLHWKGRGRGPRPTFPVYLDNERLLCGGRKREGRGRRKRPSSREGPGSRGEFCFESPQLELFYPLREAIIDSSLPEFHPHIFSNHSQRANILQKSLATVTLSY